MTAIERELTATFRAATARTVESEDLYERVARAIAAGDERRRRYLHIGIGAIAVLIASGTLILSLLEEGSVHMRWYILELLTNLVLLATAVGLGPLIKRFGKSYAGDVFRANPRTGKSYLALTDVAYYLIFLSYIMFTMSFERDTDWTQNVSAEQLKIEVSRLGGILLIIGLLHAANIVFLPVIGRLLTMNKQLDDSINAPPAARAPDSGHGTGAAPGGGAWILRIEPAPGSPPIVGPDDNDDEI
ncbi:MAG: hypothetical protein ABIQ73_10275 [Acidimicrobiales bacterium]